MSEETTNPNGSSKKQLARVDETPEEIEKRIVDAGYGDLKIGRVLAVHGAEFGVLEEPIKDVSEEQKKRGILSSFLHNEYSKKKPFIPEEYAKNAMIGKVGKQKDRKDKKDKKESIQSEKSNKSNNNLEQDRI